MSMPGETINNKRILTAEFDKDNECAGTLLYNSQNTENNSSATGTRRKNLRTEDSQYACSVLELLINNYSMVARRADILTKISAIDELVAKLQSSPDSCSIYRSGMSGIDTRYAQRLQAAEFRLTAARNSINTNYSSTLSQLAKAEKVFFYNS